MRKSESLHEHIFSSSQPRWAVSMKALLHSVSFALSIGFNLRVFIIKGQVPWLLCGSLLSVTRIRANQFRQPFHGTECGFGLRYNTPQEKSKITNTLLTLWSEHVAIHRSYKIHRLLLFFCKSIANHAYLPIVFILFYFMHFYFSQQPSDNFERSQREKSRIRLMDLLNISLNWASLCLHSSDGSNATSKSWQRLFLPPGVSLSLLLKPF